MDGGPVCVDLPYHQLLLCVCLQGQGRDIIAGFLTSYSGEGCAAVAAAAAAAAAWGEKGTTGRMRRVLRSLVARCAANHAMLDAVRGTGCRTEAARRELRV